MKKPEFRYKTLPLLSLRERKYLTCLNEILIKPNWWTKISSESTVSKWKQELAAQMSKDTSRNDQEEPVNDGRFPVAHHVSDSEFAHEAVAFVFNELDFISKNELIILPNGGVITPTSNHGVFLSDAAVPDSVLDDFRSAVAPLEQAALQKNKWHEGSDGKVLDIVHPSDYCLVYGRSMLRTNSSEIFGTTVAQFPGDATKATGDVSTRFQWLPSEFAVDNSGRVNIRSYINNLNSSQHPRLHGGIEKIFEHILPMFENCLGAFESDPFVRIDAPPQNDRYQAPADEWMIDQFVKHKHGPDADLSDAALRNVRGDPEYDEYEETLWDAPRPIYVPGFSKDVTPAMRQRCEIFSLKGRSLQVIVKIANICLTPEKPIFNGGSWHLEGMENEAIAATGIVYYDMDNITPSRLSFRSIFDEEVFEYDQSDFRGLEVVFGFENEVSLNTQSHGQIEARKGRCVVFPNFLHHKVEDFELADKSRSGHRKILAFFLVHPSFRVTSTAEVPMQQCDWVAEQLYQKCFKKNFPLEVCRIVADASNSTMSEEEAAQYAHQVMEERKNTPEDGYANVQNIFLCEH
ncbi:hypothetical protein HDU83_005077 [Entophlyctis luteolus]|nr:hypothetical protein HDU83_005077 [Entophlyctis luteolus]